MGDGMVLRDSAILAVIIVAIVPLIGFWRTGSSWGSCGVCWGS